MVQAGRAGKAVAPAGAEGADPLQASDPCTVYLRARAGEEEPSGPTGEAPSTKRFNAQDGRIDALEQQLQALPGEQKVIRRLPTYVWRLKGSSRKPVRKCYLPVQLHAAVAGELGFLPHGPGGPADAGQPRLCGAQSYAAGRRLVQAFQAPCARLGRRAKHGARYRFVTGRTHTFPGNFVSVIEDFLCLGTALSVAWCPCCVGEAAKPGPSLREKPILLLPSSTPLRFCTRLKRCHSLPMLLLRLRLPLPMRCRS